MNFFIKFYNEIHVMRLLYIQMAFYAALSSLFLIYGTCSQFTPANHSAPQAILYLAFTKRDDGESRSPPGDEG